MERYGTGDKRVSRDTADAYVDRALTAVSNAPLNDESLDRIRTAIERLIDSDEEKLLQILERQDWPSLIKKALALTMRRHRLQLRQAGESADDYVHEAVALLLERRRHFPFYRGVSLLKFLVRTIDNLIDHVAKKSVRDGHPLRIVSAHDEGLAADECLEEHIASPVPSRESELIASENAEGFLRSMRDDPPLEAYARLRAFDLCPSAESYARSLATTVKDIRNRERRFMRRLRRLEIEQFLPTKCFDGKKSVADRRDTSWMA